MNLAALATAGLVFCRVTGLVAGLPVFSAQGTPKAVPILVGVGTVLAVAPAVPVADVPLSVGALMVGVFGELAVGLTAGMAVRVVFVALALGTELMAAQMGLAMATMLNPLEKHQAGPMGTLASWAAGLAFLSGGLHLRCLEAVALSFHVLPPGGGFDMALLEALSNGAATSIVLGVQLSGPVLLMVWFVNVLVAVLARLAPRMNVFFSVGMTLTSSLGILLVATSLPWVLGVHAAAVRDAVDTAFTHWTAPPPGPATGR